MLLGVSLLFWGGITGHPLVGLILAAGTEGAHWTRFRWDFTDRTVERAWGLSMAMLFLTALLVWLNGSLSDLPDTVVWLPLIFFPLQFVQGYGMGTEMPLSAFSAMTRRRKEHARRHGLPFREIHFAFGHVYFSAILIAASLGDLAKSAVFFPVVVVLVAWAFHRRLRSVRRRLSLAGLAFILLATAGGYSGEEALEYLYRRLAHGSYRHNDALWARQKRTAIGSFEEIKQSPAIHWRLLPVDGPLPPRLRIASYNSFSGSTWHTLAPENAPPEDFREVGFFGIDEPFRITARGEEDQFIPGEEAASPDHPRFILRGSFPELGLLPLPGDAASLVLPAQNMEINSFGTLRVDPSHPVANATILWDEELNTGLPPWEKTAAGRTENPALRIPSTERDGIRRVVDRLGLRELPLEAQIQSLRAFFFTEFSYTRYLERPKPQEPGGFVTQFLENSRRGHCEYFATAAALLLREAGVPTHYATGFAVLENDPRTGGAILRGIHAHAWCLAWDERTERWLDVDLTPPTWIARETPRTPPWQGLLDRWSILRDDLLVWRTQPGNLAIAAAVIFIPLILGGLLIGRRLWSSKKRVEAGSKLRASLGADARTPLTDLEKSAARVLGPRPPGHPLGRWLTGLAAHLGDPAPLAQAIALHRTARFDPDADPEALRGRLAALAAEIEDDLRRLAPATPRGAG